MWTRVAIIKTDLVMQDRQRMGPASRPRSGQRQIDLDLSKYITQLSAVPDEQTMGRLQDALEALLSERSHPMVMALSKQRDQLSQASALVGHEIELRESKKQNIKLEVGDKPNRKRGRSRTQTPEPEPEEGGETKDSENAGSESEVDAKSVAKGSEESGSANDTKRRRIEDTDEAAETKEESDDESGGIDRKHKNVSDKTTSPNETSAGRFVANPKSEYVSTQSMPVHTFSVFTESDQEDEDEEAHKRRLGVVSYPKEDLSTLTAGPVPLDDFTRSKPSNQVQFSTYATFLEPYFRPFSDEDMQFLEQPIVGGGVESINLKTGKRLSPYVIPPLGPSYHHNWAVQDAELSGVEVSAATRKEHESQVADLAKIYDAAGSINDISESTLETPSALSLGPFTERLISAVISETTEDPTATASITNEEGHSLSSIPAAPQGTPQITDFNDLEERVRSEFQYAGVFDVGLLHKFDQEKSGFRLAASRLRDDFADPTNPEVDWVNGAEDDEICREMRFLQSKLKVVTQRNAQYKARLRPVIQEQLSWQEYQSILQDLDKQVDQAYQKRQKLPAAKQKKKISGRLDSPLESNGGTPQPSAPETPDSSKMVIEQRPTIKALMDKRERWISKIGPLFRPAHEMMREYEIPKFSSLEEISNDE